MEVAGRGEVDANGEKRRMARNYKGAQTGGGDPGFEEGGRGEEGLHSSGCL